MGLNTAPILKKVVLMAYAGAILCIFSGLVLGIAIQPASGDSGDEEETTTIPLTATFTPTWSEETPTSTWTPTPSDTPAEEEATHPPGSTATLTPLPTQISIDTVTPIPTRTEEPTVIAPIPTNTPLLAVSTATRTHIPPTHTPTQAAQSQPTSTPTRAPTHPPTLAPPVPAASVTPGLIPVTGTDPAPFGGLGGSLPIGLIAVGMCLLGVGVGFHGAWLKASGR